MSPTEKRIHARRPSRLAFLKVCEAGLIQSIAKLEAEHAEETKTIGFPSDISWEMWEIRSEQLRQTRLEIASLEKKKKKA